MKFLKLFVFSFSLLSCLLFVSPVFAAPNLRAQINENTAAGVEQSGLGNAAPQDVAARMIKVILTVVGITFTVLMVFAGYNILTAGGDEGKVEKAKKTIMAAVIGLAITLGAYGITKFLGEAAVTITTENPTKPVDDKSGADEFIEMFTGGDDGSSL